MHITCEHCGSTIDLDKDKVCPNCGAPYNNNKEFKSVKEYHAKKKEMDLKEREMDIENKEMAKKVTKGIFAGQALSFVIFGILFVFVFVLIAYGIFKSNQNFNRSKNTNDKIMQELIKENEVEEQEEVVVGFNEIAQTEEYEIKCDGVSNYNLVSYEKDKLKNTGIVVYNFQVLLTNKTGDWTYSSYIKLTYTDKNGNENISAKRHDTFFNNPEDSKQIDDSFHDTLAHKGNISFELPKDVSNVKIIYKNAVIKLDNFKKLIK